MIRMLTLAGVAALAILAPLGADDKAPAGKAAFDRMKKLVGEWVLLDEKGQPTTKTLSVYKLTGAGSAIQETIFPGEAHEMVSVYHLDGNDLVMTHYCALGNQPKMKFDTKSGEKEFKFMFVSGSNMDAAKDLHMHEGVITLVDDDHIESKWQAFENGKPAEGHKAAFKAVRKKKS